MSDPRDRLYELLPAIYRMRDAERDYPLRSLLRVIASQVEVLEADIDRLYENWFIETCDDWVVPYIGDLVGYRQIHEAGEPGRGDTPASRRRNMVLIPRRDVANTVRSRRRRGTLALLEELAFDVAGWPARAVEFFDQLGRTLSLDAFDPPRGRSADMRGLAALGRLGGPFGELAHTVDVRRINAGTDPGRFSIHNIGLYVWRLRAYSMTGSSALRLDQHTNCFTFSVLGNDAPLFTNPRPEVDPTTIAGELSVPAPISRLAFQQDKDAYYGPGKSLAIYRRSRHRVPAERLVPAARIVAADLSEWRNRPEEGFVAVDPELGRIAFHLRDNPANLRVNYHYGFSADIGGGEYERPLSRNTVGYALIRRDHLLDEPSILAYLRDRWGPLADELRARLPTQLQREIESYADENPPDDTLVAMLIEGLNGILLGESLYSFERFPNLHLDATPEAHEAWRLVREEPRGPNLVRLNRLLLEITFTADLALSYRYYPVRYQPAEPGRQRPQPINAALEQWAKDKPRHALIEILDSSDYTEQIVIRLEPGQTLELRAGDRCRPTIRLLNVRSSDADDFTVVARLGSRLTLDGLLVVGRGLTIAGDPEVVVVRHCTLVPGWELGEHCEPLQPERPSITMDDGRGYDDGSEPTLATPHGPAAPRPRCRLSVEHSIVGSIRVLRNAVRKDPLELSVSDSIVDATAPGIDALANADDGIAHAVVTIARSTIIGTVYAHAIDLAENSILYGRVRVARSQRGCMRFCSYVPGSHTPRRFNCQPDLVERGLSDAARAAERERVTPRFSSLRYGNPAYCQLRSDCAPEIVRGSDDESEMGAFHDLFQPQRAANLRARVDEYSSAGMETGIIYVT